MGQKVHPYGFRLGTLYGWQSNWFASKNYAAQLHEDLRIRKFIKKKLYHAGISKVVIERTGDKVVVNIHIGEFSPTRKFTGHSSDKKVKR